MLCRSVRKETRGARSSLSFAEERLSLCLDSDCFRKDFDYWACSWLRGMSAREDSKKQINIDGEVWEGMFTQELGMMEKAPYWIHQWVAAAAGGERTVANLGLVADCSAWHLFFTQYPCKPYYVLNCSLMSVIEYIWQVWLICESMAISASGDVVSLRLCTNHGNKLPGRAILPWVASKHFVVSWMEGNAIHDQVGRNVKVLCPLSGSASLWWNTGVSKACAAQQGTMEKRTLWLARLGRDWCLPWNPE